MSSESREEVKSQALQAGAAEYLVKPVRRRELTNLWQHIPQQPPAGVESRSSSGTFKPSRHRVASSLLQLCLIALVDLSIPVDSAAISARGDSHRWSRWRPSPVKVKRASMFCTSQQPGHTDDS